MVEQTFKNFRILPIQESRLPDYKALFSNSYPNFRPSVEYLRWLYYENPLGHVVGFDAYDNDLLVAHYACIPTRVDSFEGLSLLALNTATLPNYQGRGLLKVLANRTYDQAGSNFAGVFGVANSRAVNALIKHLDFIQLGNLELRFGNLDREKKGSRVYSEMELQWRIRCPNKKLTRKKIGTSSEKITARPFGPLIRISALIHFLDIPSEKAESFRSRMNYGITLDWKKDASPKIFLPNRFKPSPLALVYRPLMDNDYSKLTSWSFPDFDAF
jgi:hypothetical protein